MLAVSHIVIPFAPFVKPLKHRPINTITSSGILPRLRIKEDNDDYWAPVRRSRKSNYYQLVKQRINESEITIFYRILFTDFYREIDHGPAVREIRQKERTF